MEKNQRRWVGWWWWKAWLENCNGITGKGKGGQKDFSSFVIHLQALHNMKVHSDGWPATLSPSSYPNRRNWPIKPVNEELLWNPWKGSKLRGQKLLPQRTLRTGDSVLSWDSQAGSRGFNSMVSGEPWLPNNLEIIAGGSGLWIGKHRRAQM